MWDKDLYFFTQEIKCTCKWNCFWTELLTRVWESKKSIETVLENISEYEKEDLDLLILKKLIKDINNKENKIINLNVHIWTLLNDEYIENLYILKNLWLKIYVEILETTKNLENNIWFLDLINKQIKILQWKWIKIWLDDYPAWNTKFLLKYLTQLDFIKIDKQVLLKESSNFIKIINNYVNEIKVYQKNALIIVEWVEDWKYIDVLLELWVDAFQWYYFWKPKEIKKDLSIW